MAIAHRFAKEGAKVVISSRKQQKVDKAVELLKKENLECHGLVCHVAKPEDRKNLINEVFTSQRNTFLALYIMNPRLWLNLNNFEIFRSIFPYDILGKLYPRQNICSTLVSDVRESN